GTGCSSSVPNARCLIQPTDPPCAVCTQSLSVPPERNPNYRWNLIPIVLTHEHADAVLGLDDIRVVQPFSATNDVDPTPVYLSQYAMDSLFLELQVIHGEDYVSLGFLFGKKSRVAYISDVSRFPASTENVISKSGAGQLDLLILDTLYKVS
ncbi:hypothetical protein GW17_00053158, partial [Ensete ventricosum]